MSFQSQSQDAAGVSGMNILFNTFPFSTNQGLLLGSHSTKDDSLCTSERTPSFILYAVHEQEHIYLFIYVTLPFIINTGFSNLNLKIDI